MSSPTDTIADIVVQNSGSNGLQAFDVLLAALTAVDPAGTGLLGAASNPAASLTVFAPTDGAFINLAQVIDPGVNTEAGAVATLAAASALLSPSSDPTAFLSQVLSYHIVAGSQSLAQVQGQASITTLFGTDVRPSGNTLRDAEPDLPDPEFVPGLTDLPAANGTVHVIDEVLVPYDLIFMTGRTVFAGGGNDAVIGNGLNNRIFLGSGDDIANGGAGNDLIFGGWGDDLLLGGTGRDKLFGGFGDDLLEGQDGRDHLSGGFGNDILFGGDDRDYLSGGWGQDIIVGGSGNDFLKGGKHADTFVFNPLNIGENGEKLEGHDFVRDFKVSQGDRIALDLTSLDDATAAAVAGTTGDPNAIGLDDLAELGLLSLSETWRGDLVVEHAAGEIVFKGVPGDVGLDTLESLVDIWLA